MIILLLIVSCMCIELVFVLADNRWAYERCTRRSTLAHDVVIADENTNELIGE